jgi:hypothetical protein
MKAQVFALAVLAAPVLAAAPQPSSSSAWLHVRVEEPSRKSRVHVNLPLPVVEAALKAAPHTIGSEGRINLRRHGVHFGHDHHVGVAELRAMWKELKNAGDTEIVNVEDREGTVSVARKGDLVQVRVQQEGRSEKVHVDVPVALVDALLSAEGEELDIRAGIAELRKLRGDIVRVDDKDTSVRVWIDENAGSGGGR